MTGSIPLWRLIRSGGVLLFAALAVAGWWIAQDAAARAAYDARRASLRCPETPVEAKAYPDMLDVEARADVPGAFALWKQREGQRVEDRLSGRQKKVAVLLVEGDTKLVLPVYAALAEDDRDGCLVDRATAQEIFGDENAVGAEIVWGEREYTVRGVFPSHKATVVARPGPAEKLENVSLESGRDWQTFAMRHEMEVYLAVESSTWAYFAGVFARLPVLALLGVFMGGLSRLRGANRDYPVRESLASALMLAAGTGMFLYLLLLLPSSLIPTRWSDFSFWEEALPATGEGWMELLIAQKTRPDLYYLGLVGKSGYGILSAWSLCMGQGWWRWASRRLDGIQAARNVKG